MEGEQYGTVSTISRVVAGGGPPHLWEGSTGVYGVAQHEWL